jgi:hypothetical protein
MQAHLKKHDSGFSNYSIKVNWHRSAHEVVVDFHIHRRTGKGWEFDDKFSSDWAQNWGLWNKDVFEAFLQLRSDDSDLIAPYLEVQVSPLNQPFALLVVEPRKVYYPPESLILDTQVSIGENSWAGKVTVSLPRDLKGHLLYGGFFSCLGPLPREYYALNPNLEEKPDFHRPDLFYPLDER